MMRNLVIIAVAAISLVLGTLKSQGQGMAVNTSGAAANSSAMLDVSSTTQGVLVPRMTTAQRTAISSPATGLLVYQTDGTAGFYFYNGTAWTSLSSSGGGSPTGAAGGDLTGTYPNPTISSSAGTGNDIVTAVNACGGGLSGTKLAVGTVSVTAMSATGTRSATTYLRGDNSWGTPSGGSSYGSFDSITSAGNFTVPSTAQYVIYNFYNSSTTITMTLPAASTYTAGQILYYICPSAAGNQSINFKSAGGSIMDPQNGGFVPAGTVTGTLSTAPVGIGWVTDGTTWFEIAQIQ